MYKGKINLIERTTFGGRPAKSHAGVRVNGIMVSVCNLEWKIDDKVSTADTSKVTCMKCLKMIANASEDGTCKVGGSK